MSQTGARRDLYGGGLCALIGCLACYVGAGYERGTLADIGPGLFPMAIGVLLAIVGLAVAAASGRDTPEHRSATQWPDLRGAACIAGGMIAFGVLGVYGGLAPASFALVFIAALGDRQNSLRQAAVAATVLTAVGVVVFWWALQLQIPLFAWGTS